MGRKSVRRSDTLLSEARRADAEGLLVLELRGNGYQMGYQHGTLARGRIRALHAEVLDYLRDQMPHPRGVPERATRSALRSMLTYQMARFRPLVPEELWAEMEGIADGSGLTPYDILLLNALWEHVTKTTCTHFAISGTSGTRGPIHAVNLAVPEWSTLNWSRYRVLILAHPAEGQPFAHVGLAGSVGVIAGMGVNGLAVSWERRSGGPLPVWRQMGEPYRPIGFTGRRIVQFGRNLHTAERIARSDLPRPAEDILLVSSAQEKASVGLEIAQDRVAARHVGSDLVASGGVFTREAERQGLSARLWELLGDASERLEVTDAIRALRHPYPAEGEGQWHPMTDTICHADTLISVVMEADAVRIWAATGGPPAPLGAYAGYNLSRDEPLQAAGYVPATGFYHARQACLHLLAREWERAQAQADKAASVDGQTVPLALIRARALAGQGEHEQAIQALKPALQSGASRQYRAVASHQLTQLYIAMERTKEASKAAARRDAFLREAQGQVQVALPSAIDPAILLELSSWNVSEGRMGE